MKDMLTLVTQTAIAILAEIGKDTPCIDAEHLYSDELCQPDLLSRLESGGLISRLPEHSRNRLSSYRLVRPAREISLLDVLMATGEHLNCNSSLGEKFYHKYGTAARKLGVLNSVMCQFLSEIHLSEL